ncbi:bifunctional serine/threonine-protein kinase/glutamate ABC transporter substrate-binding protein [Wenjunlia tyrosinilytica]|uniref:Serine/threonine protein kinase n=1 Tax=Wenjunlia tyrosinilytica TaxID=1544741 RepID=A0A917ZSF8_9ACTN|nr:bifunctional serine/threonine-protein kinase/glutamate ABC transporter substrate-binding protein [Wenjunlia tyrosinilytica]GGO91502.1 serine/threonine protein kinase [Wenjunlia tyrosinilytica]
MRTVGPTPGGDPRGHAGTGTGSPHALIDNRYELQRPLGRGGMGVVWEALDTRLNRQVAIKELLFRGAVDPETQAQWVERARREAQAIARIGHEHVVAVHDVIEDDGQVWIVMEQVNPRSLSDLLRDHERLPVASAARVGLEVLRGLRAVHAAGVLHRDVKPHNVLFRKDGRAVLMDFGIATFEGAAQVTRRHETVGTPQYLPPELAVPWTREQRTATPASDLWSLGVTLYEMVEGRAPFRGPTPFEVLEAVREEEPPEMVHAGPLRPLIEGLLVKDPEKRLSAERAEELLQHVAQETPSTAHSIPHQFYDPSAAPDPPRSETSRLRAVGRPSRRVRRAAGAGALAVALLAGTGWVAVNVFGSDSAPSLHQSDTYRRAKQLGLLRIGVKSDQPGLSEVVNDKEVTYRGFDIDIAHAIAKRLGFREDQVDFQVVNTASREYRLSQGKVDLIVASYSITDERKRQVDFAGPYYIAGQDFLVRKKDTSIDGKEDLGGKTVCTVDKSTPAAQLPLLSPKPNVTLRNQYGKCIEALLAGAVDAVSTDDVILAGYRREHPRDLRLLGDPFTTEAYGIGLPKDDPALKRAVCDALKKEVANGDWDRFYRKNLKPLDPEQLGDLRPPEPRECGAAQ